MWSVPVIEGTRVVWLFRQGTNIKVEKAKSVIVAEVDDIYRASEHKKDSCDSVQVEWPR